MCFVVCGLWLIEMKILLTGASGFLGSHLAKSFVESGYEVHALIRKSSKLTRLAGYEDKLTLYFIEDGIDKVFAINSPYKAVIHTATCYGRNNETETEIFNVNLKFPLELLENSVSFNTDTFLNTDTILYKYMNSYALSKKQFVEWGKQFASQEKIKFCNIKLEHMYGSGDDKSKFTTYIINSCINNVPVIKLTPGEQKRDFIYIDDVISAYHTLLKNNSQNSFEEFQLGSGEAITIREFVEEVHSITQSKSKLDFSAYPYRENEIMESKAEIRKLIRLGWEPKINLETALKKIVGSCESL